MYFFYSMNLASYIVAEIFTQINMLNCEAFKKIRAQ
jgi:hypothetical protein